MMRNFEERIAEINRRSEAILKQRKKRKKQILSLCIPLVLCTAIVIPQFLPKVQTEESGQVESVVLKENSPVKNNSLSSRTITEIQIASLSHTEVITDQKHISKISDFLYSVTESPIIPESNETRPDAEANPSFDNSTSTENNAYQISLYTDDGMKDSFLLSGDLILVDNKTGKKYELTGNQAEELQTLLSKALILVDNKTGKVFELE